MIFFGRSGWLKRRLQSFSVKETVLKKAWMKESFGLRGADELKNYEPNKKS